MSKKKFEEEKLVNKSEKKVKVDPFDLLKVVNTSDAPSAPFLAQGIIVKSGASLFYGAN